MHRFSFAQRRLVVLAATILSAAPGQTLSALAAEDADGTPALQTRSPDGVWLKLDATASEALAGQPRIRPVSGQTIRLEAEMMNDLLAEAPLEGEFPVRQSPAVITLPRPDGGFERFAFVESSIMHPDLQAEFPEIRSYLGQGLDNPAATVRFDVSLLGFRAQVLGPWSDGPDVTGAWYIDPVSAGDTLHYTSYWRGSLSGPASWTCATPQPEVVAPPDADSIEALRGGLEVVRNEFGIAVAATGEFSVGIAAQMNPPQTPSVGLTMSVINTTLTRVNQILERDGPVRLLLVQNNSSVIYIDPLTDPYDTSVPQSQMQTNFQNNFNNVIGTTSYSLGHTFHWQASSYQGSAGGIGTVCNDTNKGLAFSATSNATGDYFMIDLVAHEIGHQLGATHTFNGVAGACSPFNSPPQWTGDTAYEPGSGSTIMSYGGTCGVDNVVFYPPSPPPPPLPPTANGAKVPMFNFSSMIQIANVVTGVSCVARIPTGNTHPGATPHPQGPFVVPTDTPFRLLAPSAQTLEPGETIIYSIEQADLGPQRALGQDADSHEPLFRVLAPSTVPERWFPTADSVLNGTVVIGENLARYSRNSLFKGVLRDNVAGAGGWGMGDIQGQFVLVPLPGFRVTAPAGGGAYCAGQVIGVTWNVAGTNEAPISAETVDILMSTDNGQNFPWTLAADFPNSGAALVPLPSVPTTQARIKVQSSGGLFYHVNAGPFEVATAPPTIAAQPTGVAVCRFNPVTLTVGASGGSPRHFQWYKNSAPLAGATDATFHIEFPDYDDSGDYRVVISNGCGQVTSNTVRVQVGVTFDAQPANQTPQPCQTVMLSAPARGVGALTYRWMKDGVDMNDGDHIAGTVTSALTLAGVRYGEDEGNYWCRVTDQCETRTTRTASVTLPTPTWVQRSTTGPIRRGTYTIDMAYDPVRGVCVIYGGVHPDGQSLDETWEWDGVDWMQRFPAHNPGRRYQYEMAFDTVRNAVLLFGGWGYPPTPTHNSEVWSYDGNDWALVTTSPDGPPANVGSQGDIAFDSARGKMILLYENSGATQWPVPGNDTWEFDSTMATWQLASTGLGPYFFNSPIAFDPSRGFTVGQFYWPTFAYSDARTWTSMGAGWLEAGGAATPPRYYPVMAFDSVRRRATTYGCCRNQGPGQYIMDTWEFNGAQWGQVLPDLAPSQLDAVIPAGMAFDTRRRAMVMIGSAYNDAYYASEQTWEYRYLDQVMFDRQPASLSVEQGDTAAFSVVAAGAGTLNYRWRHGGVDLADGSGPGSSTISGAATPTLAITSVSLLNAGDYDVVVTNLCGAQTSQEAMLTVGGAGLPGDCDDDGDLDLDDYACFAGCLAGPDVTPAVNCESFDLDDDNDGDLLDFAEFQAAFTGP